MDPMFLAFHKTHQYSINECRKSPFHVRKKNNDCVNLTDRCKNKSLSMKQLKYQVFLLVILIINSSCNKNKIEYDNIMKPVKKEEHAVSRKIQFSLYSNKNFENDNHLIQFSVFIRNSNNQILWDSMLPLMSIRKIPAEINKIFIEKQIPDSDSSLLKAGFIYSIEDVGISWYLDTCSKSTAIKKIDYNFR